MTDPVHIGNHVFTAGQIANYAVVLGSLITLIGFFFKGLLEATRLLRAWRQPGIVTQSNGIL
jgi:hypothetical protein